MRFCFDPSQEFQIKVIEVVTGVLCGQSKVKGHTTVGDGHHSTDISAFHGRRCGKTKTGPRRPPKAVMAVLDVDVASPYCRFSIEPESPAKGDSVQNKKLAAQRECAYE